MPPTTAGRQFVEAEVLYAEDVVLQPVISCSSIGKRRSSSLHAIWFVGKLELWDDFEDEVKRNFANIRWENFTAPIAYEVCGKEKSQLPMHRKNHYLCGEESSISGRWVQHVLHPMSVISKVLDYKMVFGDWKATNKRTINFGKAKRAVPLGEKKETDGIRKRQYLIPDYALMVEESGAPRAVGEAKTPWNHDFEQLWVDFGESKHKMDMRRALGKHHLLVLLILPHVDHC